MSVKIVAFILTGAIVLAMDAVWLSLMAGVYRRLGGDLFGASFLIAPAIAFYLLYVLGVVVFAVLPALEEGSWPSAASRGALLGLVAYGTYDLTNQATLKSWPWQLSAIDMTWGTALTAIAAGLATALLLKYF